MRRFFYHYNKPLSRKSGEDWLTIHYKNSCIPVKKIICNVPTESYNRKSQPRVVIRGFGVVEIKNDIANIF